MYGKTKGSGSDSEFKIKQLGWVTLDEQCQGAGGATAPVPASVPVPLNNDSYESFQRICDLFDYTFATYEARTEDGWILTLFRITGKKDEPPRQYSSRSEPILF